jgi:hypothetical protein
MKKIKSVYIIVRWKPLNSKDQLLDEKIDSISEDFRESVLKHVSKLPKVSVIKIEKNG